MLKVSYFLNSPLLTRKASSFEDEGFESRPADQNVLSTQLLLCVHTRDWKYAETDWAGLCSSQVVSRGIRKGRGEQKAQPRAGISSLQGQHLAYTHAHTKTKTITQTYNRPLFIYSFHLKVKLCSLSIIYLSIYFCLYPSLSLFSHYLSFSLSLSIFLFLSIYLFFYVSLSLSICSLSLSPFLSLYLSPSFYYLYCVTLFHYVSLCKSNFLSCGHLNPNRPTPAKPA